MPDPNHFQKFPDLPVEIRLQIWTEALRSPTLWACIRTRSQPPSTKAPQPAFKMKCIGSHKPYLISLSCREAHSISEKVLTPVQSPNSPTHCLNFSTTVIHLGDCQDALSFPKNFSPQHLEKFKHLAFTYNSSNKPFEVENVVKHLVGCCENVENIVIGKPAYFPANSLWVISGRSPPAMSEGESSMYVRIGVGEGGVKREEQERQDKWPFEWFDGGKGKGVRVRRLALDSNS